MSILGIQGGFFLKFVLLPSFFPRIFLVFLIAKKSRSKINFLRKFFKLSNKIYFFYCKTAKYWRKYKHLFFSQFSMSIFLSIRRAYKKHTRAFFPILIHVCSLSIIGHTRGGSASITYAGQVQRQKHPKPRVERKKRIESLPLSD